MHKNIFNFLPLKYLIMQCLDPVLKCIQVVKTDKVLAEGVPQSNSIGEKRIFIQGNYI